jgi:hypothetical protein
MPPLIMVDVSTRAFVVRSVATFTGLAGTVVAIVWVRPKAWSAAVQVVAIVVGVWIATASYPAVVVPPLR